MEVRMIEKTTFNIAIFEASINHWSSSSNPIWKNGTPPYSAFGGFGMQADDTDETDCHRIRRVRPEFFSRETESLYRAGEIGGSKSRFGRHLLILSVRISSFLQYLCSVSISEFRHPWEGQKKMVQGVFESARTPFPVEGLTGQHFLSANRFFP